VGRARAAAPTAAPAGNKRGGHRRARSSGADGHSRSSGASGFEK